MGVHPQRALGVSTVVGVDQEYNGACTDVLEW